MKLAGRRFLVRPGGKNPPKTRKRGTTKTRSKRGEKKRESGAWLLGVWGKPELLGWKVTVGHPLDGGAAIHDFSSEERERKKKKRGEWGQDWRVGTVLTKTAKGGGMRGP